MELTITIKPQELATLQQRAASNGVAVQEEASSIIAQELYIDAVLTRVRGDFANSG